MIFFKFCTSLLAASVFTCENPRRNVKSSWLQDLERKFEKYGPVKDARIVRNPRSGESRGFGFLIMENDDDVDRVHMSHSCF